MSGVQGKHTVPRAETKAIIMAKEEIREQTQHATIHTDAEYVIKRE